MTGRRRKDHHLPLRVYVIRGAHVYVDKTGKQHRLGREWDAAAKARWIELSTGQAADGTVAALLDEFLKHCEGEVRAGRRAKRTLADNETEAKVLKKIFGRMQARSVTKRHVATYLVRRTDEDGNPAPVRANREVAFLSSAFSWALAREEWSVESNPCHGVRRNRESPRTTYIASRDLVAFGRAEKTPKWMRGYCVLKRLTGLRQGDMLNLTRASMTPRGLETGIGKVSKRMTFRWTWALRIAVKWILAHPACGGESINPFFPSIRGGALTARGFKTAWNRAMRAHVAAGGTWLRENDIRAKTASDAASTDRAQELLAHQSPAMAKRVYRRKTATVTPLR